MTIMIYGLLIRKTKQFFSCYAYTEKSKREKNGEERKGEKER